MYLEIEQEAEVGQGVDTKTGNLIPMLIKKAYTLDITFNPFRSGRRAPLKGP
jgi:hypothetical protein